jgi:6-phosphogluconolactonase
MTDDPSPRAAAYLATQGLRGERVIAPDVDKLIDLVAHDLMAYATQRVSAAGEFHLALSGGSTPQALYQRLMIDPRYRLLPWPMTHLWIVDERCVPVSDERSNYKMIRELIVDHAGVVDAHVHPMPVSEHDGDALYERELRRGLAAAGGRLDYVLLGMGGDGHTASLFPATPALDETERWVVFNDGESVAAPRPRMTMTYPLINAARRIALLVTGQSKHAMIRQVTVATGSPTAPKNLPVTGIAPSEPDGKMTWFLDHAAALGQKA